MNPDKCPRCGAQTLRDLGIWPVVNPKRQVHRYHCLACNYYGIVELPDSPVAA